MTTPRQVETKNIVVIALIMIITLIYSIVRYNVFGPVTVTDIPTYILNKSIAFTMIIVLPMISFYKRKQKQAALDFSITCLQYLAAVHILLSISLLSQSYFTKLFIDNKLTLLGNLAVLCGILTFVTGIFSKFRINMLLIYLLIALHISFLGAKGWFDVAKWNGYMPPITLLCFLVLSVLIILSLTKNQNQQDR